MNVLFVASELAPYARTGGLGDVMASLPTEVARRGHSVSFAVPLYRSLKEKFKDLKETELVLSVSGPGYQWPTRVWQGTTPEGASVFAIQRDEYFDRKNLYGNEDGDYLDSVARFSFFNRAVVELARHIEPQVEIIHCNDWHTGLIPAYVRSEGLPFRTVLTIHNLAYQGIFSGSDFPLTLLPQEYFSPQGIEFYDRMNFLKGGILLANAVTTVSKGYAREIQTEQYGYGLHRVLAENNFKLTGILNGIDQSSWDPARDKTIAAPFDAKKLTGKKACREDLLKTVKLPDDDNDAVIGVVSRLVRLKGFGLLIDSLEELLKRKVKIIVLGQGDPKIEEILSTQARKNPKQMKVKIGFDDKLARKIYAGSDFFLMPSEQEPCGLTQLYSLRYGTIPVVRDTGGLSDTVTEWNGEEGTGFKFVGGPEALLKKIDDALALRKDKKGWPHIRKNAMGQDFSWGRSVEEYESLYKKLLTT